MTMLSNLTIFFPCSTLTSIIRGVASASTTTIIHTRRVGIIPPAKRTVMGDVHPWIVI